MCGCVPRRRGAERIEPKSSLDRDWLAESIEMGWHRDHEHAAHRPPALDPLPPIDSIEARACHRYEVWGTDMPSVACIRRPKSGPPESGTSGSTNRANRSRGGMASRPGCRRECAAHRPPALDPRPPIDSATLSASEPKVSTPLAFAIVRYIDERRRGRRVHGNHKERKTKKNSSSFEGEPMVELELDARCNDAATCGARLILLVVCTFSFPFL